LFRESETYTSECQALSDLGALGQDVTDPSGRLT